MTSEGVNYRVRMKASGFEMNEKHRKGIKFSLMRSVYQLANRPNKLMEAHASTELNQTLLININPIWTL